MVDNSKNGGKMLDNGIRRNVATVSEEERTRLRDAFVKLHDDSDPRVKYPDGVRYWTKVNDMHDWGHEVGVDIHGGPGFLPWHRELLMRLEKQLQEADKLLGHDGKIMLHYWDWRTDPRGGNGVVNLCTPAFMGSANGVVGDPFADFESIQPGHAFIWRNVNHGLPGAPSKDDIPDDEIIITPDSYEQFRRSLEGPHDMAHLYLGGGMSDAHFSFTDPLVLLLHSNVDRIWAKWQKVPGKEWRLDGDSLYGTEGTNPILTHNIQPWAGDFDPANLRLRPWAAPENLSEIKSYKDPSIVIPPLYDTNL